VVTRLVFLLVLMLPAVAFGQGASIDDLRGEGFDWQTLIPAIVAGVIAVASALSSIFPSVGKVMKIIDVIALNVGKARNDTRVQ